MSAAADTVARPIFVTLETVTLVGEVGRTVHHVRDFKEASDLAMTRVMADPSLASAGTFLHGNGITVAFWRRADADVLMGINNQKQP